MVLNEVKRQGAVKKNNLLENYFLSCAEKSVF